MELKLTLIGETENSTASILTAGKQFLGFIIEDGYRVIKEYGDTRIEARTFELIPRKVGRFFTKYQQRFGHEFSIELKDTNHHTAILIHIGNFIKDTLGCLLINKELGFDGTNYYGKSSTGTYKAFYELVKKAFDRNERVFITIER